MPRRSPGLLERVGAWLVRRGRENRERVYAGAQSSRLTGDWYTQLLSADQELKGDLRKLRGAARALVRDDPHATRFVNLLQENVIGTAPNGITLQARNKTTRGTPATTLNDAIEAEWKAWCEPENASLDAFDSWADIQDLLIRNLPADGEILLRKVRGAPNDYAFALQVLDPDLLDEQYNIPPSQGQNEVRMGVELDANGRRVAYWLWTVHPNDVLSVRQRKRERVPADEIIHRFIRFRPGQTRGVSWFAPVLIRHQLLSGYEEAEITAARVGASNMAAVTIDPEQAVHLPDAGQEQTQIPVEVEPGLFMRLNPGEKLVSTDFNHPNAAFGPFTQTCLRAIATGLNVAHTSLTGNLADVNYSSIRAGLLSERDFYRRMQRWMITHVCRPVFRDWAKHAALMGRLPARELAATTTVTWEPRGWPWVDPRNDAEAVALKLAMGMTSRTRELAAMGEDFEETLGELANEDALASAAGVSIAPPTTQKSAAPQAGPASGDGASGDAENAPQRAALPVRLIRGQ